MERKWKRRGRKRGGGDGVSGRKQKTHDKRTKNVLVNSQDTKWWW